MDKDEFGSKLVVVGLMIELVFELVRGLGEWVSFLYFLVNKNYSKEVLYSKEDVLILVRWMDFFIFEFIDFGSSEMKWFKLINLFGII